MLGGDIVAYHSMLCYHITQRSDSTVHCCDLARRLSSAAVQQCGSAGAGSVGAVPCSSTIGFALVAHWQRRSGPKRGDNQALLRSAKVPLPGVHDANTDFATILPPYGAILVPMQSSIATRSVVPKALYDALQAEVAQQLTRMLVTHPEELPLISPMANFPRPEIFFNTKLSRQHSRPSAKALAEPQDLERTCTACWSGSGTRGAHCFAGEMHCMGCDCCVGRRFHCPACGCTFERRWIYETGSGVSSIGRAPDHFEVFPFTMAQEAAAGHLDMAACMRGGPRQSVRSCVLVGYLGADFCASCALGLPHLSKQCGSVLHAHKDRAGGANSQSALANRTLSVGATRSLHMQLRLPHNGVHGCDALVGGSIAYSCGSGPAAEVQFDLTHGTEFILEPSDEELLPRAAGNGLIAMGSFYHGMVTEVEKSAVSCGLVYRHVTSSAEVDVATNRVILSKHALQSLHCRRLARGLSNQPPWARGFRGTRANAQALARDWWSQHATAYGAKMKPVLERALAEWHTAATMRATEEGAVPEAGCSSKCGVHLHNGHMCT